MAASTATAVPCAAVAAALLLVSTVMLMPSCFGRAGRIALNPGSGARVHLMLDWRWMAAVGSYELLARPGPGRFRGHRTAPCIRLCSFSSWSSSSWPTGPRLFAKKGLGDRFAQPVDGGLPLPVGQPLFGPAKTVRGVIFSILANPLAAWLMGFDWQVGALIAAGSVAGDLFSSFVKRRLGLPASSMAIGLDHVPESLFPLAACRLLLPVTFLDIFVGVAIFFAGGLILSPILFRWHIRDRPY